MKLKNIILALALTAVLASCGQKPAETEAQTEEGAAAVEAQAEKPAKVQAPSKALLDSVSYFIGIDNALSLKRYDFGELNVNKLAKGFKAAQAVKGNPNDPDFFEKNFKVTPDVLNQTINRYLQQRHEYTLAAAIEKGQKFLASNKKKAGVQETESGLQYKIIEAGDENLKPAIEDTVFVHYEGKLLDGTVFDAVAEDKEAIRFPLNNVIEGWREGIQLVGKGGKIQLFIPSELAYGEMGSYPTIGPNETLIFDVTLDDVVRAIPVEPEAPEAE